MDKTCDVAVVGGGFAGLSSALTAAKKGLKVCILEKNRKIGQDIKTTGMFIQSVIDDFSLPTKFIENEIRGMAVYSSGKRFEIRLKHPRFYLTDTSSVLKWFAEKCVSWGCDIKTGFKVNDVKISKDKVRIKGIESKSLILACGSDTPLIKKVCGVTPERFLIGMELIIDGVKVRDESVFEAFFDYNLAPGYGGWVNPSGKNRAHIGLCRYHPCKVDVERLLLGYFMDRLKKRFKIIERRGGLIPISGPIRKTYGDRYIVVGDAAGQVGSMTAAGIHYSLKIGRIAGKVLAANIEKPLEENLRSYEVEWKNKFSNSINYELFLRSLFERFNSNEKIGDLFKIMNQQFVVDDLRGMLEKTDIKSLNVFHDIFKLLFADPKSVMKLVSDIIS